MHSHKGIDEDIGECNPTHGFEKLMHTPTRTYADAHIRKYTTWHFHHKDMDEAHIKHLPHKTPTHAHTHTCIHAHMHLRDAHTGSNFQNKAQIRKHA